MRKLAIRYSVLILCLLGSPGLTAGPDLAGAEQPAKPPKVQLREWGKGIAVDSRLREGMSIYLWFYEWNMFDARSRGQHTRGSHKWNRIVSIDGRIYLFPGTRMDCYDRFRQDFNR
jgi:hypothetical protein